MSYDPHKSLLLQLWEAAKVEYNELTRHQMKDLADELSGAQASYNTYPNGHNLARVNGLWSHGVRLLGLATTFDPAPGGGRMAVAA
jgi:hypothetical protein